MNMKKTVMSILAMGLLVCGCAKEKNDNPLLIEWKTPYQTIPFNSIKTSDYLPAFNEAIKQHNQEIDKIIANKENPNFKNTIAALDYSGQLLARVSGVFFNMASCNTNKDIQALEEKISPMVAKHNDEVMMNENLFNRVKTVWDNKSKENLTTEQQMLLKKTYHNFLRHGALLDNKQKEELKKINEEITKLETKYNSNVLAETKSYQLVVRDEKELAGLPQWLKDAAKKTASETGKQGYVFTLDNASVLPFLTYADNRKLREEIFKARISRCNNGNQYDNNKLTERLLHLRAQKAGVLGYKTYADYELEERMAKKPENADKLLKQCLSYSMKVAKQEADEFQQMLSKDEKGAHLEGWDMYYYAEKVRKVRYNFDQEQTRPYFEINNVTQGCFKTIQKLYGISFTKMTNVETYNKDVDVYEVKNEQGKHVGILYFDPYTRDSKVGGAWCNSYTPQHRDSKGNMVYPIITVCFNFAKQEGRTTLTADEAQTIFHEMGHATNEFLSDANYIGTSGTNVPTDLVELPSQVFEHWCMQPQVLNTYAKNEKGEVIPQTMIDKMNNAASFNQGFMFTELLAAAYLDMSFHSITSKDSVSLQSMEMKSMNEIGLISQIPPRYRSTYFTHIFGGGYSAGYYCYIWSEMLDADAFQAFKETGDIFNKTVAKRFKEYILSKGGTDEADIQYKKFRGKEPDLKYLLQNRGMLK